LTVCTTVLRLHTSRSNHALLPAAAPTEIYTLSLHDALPILHALAAGDTRAIPHRVAQVEHDLRTTAAKRVADHVVDLHFAAGTHAARALDAGVEIDCNGRVRQVRRGRPTRCKSGLANLHPVNPKAQLGIGRIDRLR